jgi:ISXO2-like transposase domain
MTKDSPLTVAGAAAALGISPRTAFPFDPREGEPSRTSRIGPEGESIPPAEPRRRRVRFLFACRFSGEDAITTNTVEGYYSIFKRGMKGVYQHCKEKHLHRYLAGFDFRYSNRARLGGCG